MSALERALTPEQEAFVAEVEKALHVPEHRAPVNEPLDKARSHGTPYQPKHCACQPCTFRFGHVTGVSL